MNKVAQKRLAPIKSELSKVFPMHQPRYNTYSTNAFERDIDDTWYFSVAHYGEGRPLGITVRHRMTEKILCSGSIDKVFDRLPKRLQEELIYVMDYFQ